VEFHVVVGVEAYVKEGVPYTVMIGYKQVKVGILCTAYVLACSYSMDIRNYIYLCAPLVCKFKLWESVSFCPVEINVL
jgi:hypothetical protein